jgi:hypothetical protein
LVKKTGFDHVLRVISPEKFFSSLFKRWFSGKIYLREKFFCPPVPSSSPPPARQHFWENMKKIWKNWEKYGKIGKIWHRGNFSTNVVISETGCGNFP